MKTKLSVTGVKVLDQEQALDFYVNKLGLEKAADVRQGPFRWLTVRFLDRYFKDRGDYQLVAKPEIDNPDQVTVGDSWGSRLGHATSP